MKIAYRIVIDISDGLVAIISNYFNAITHTK